MGGDLLLITGHGATTITTYNANTGQQLRQSTTPATGMVGFSIQVNESAEPEPPPEKKANPLAI
jgi:hypothetical protein